MCCPSITTSIYALERAALITKVSPEALGAAVDEGEGNGVAFDEGEGNGVADGDLETLAFGVGGAELVLVIITCAAAAIVRRERDVIIKPLREIPFFSICRRVT